MSRLHNHTTIFNSTFIIPIMIGFLVFCTVFSYELLDTANIMWLTSGDAAQHYSGWNYFRNADWELPPGQFHYDDNIKGSIVFTDSNPLISILLKPFSGLLPETFQFFGIWLLICSILQSIMLWKVFSLYTQNRVILTVSVIILMFDPAWIQRLGHINLMAFFLITAAIYVTLKSLKTQKYINRYWILLFVLSLGIHFYLFMMVGLCWFCLALHFLIKNKKSRQKILISIVINLFSIAIFAWLYGYFVMDDTSDIIRGQWGYFKANTLSLFIPNNFSYLIHIENFTPYEYEGYGYLGLGLIILLPISLGLYFFKKRSLNKKISYLAIYLFFILCFLIALSTNVSIGSYSFRISFPPALLDLTAYIRSSGRFIWPVTLLVAIFTILQTYKLKTFICQTLLIIICIIQITDTSKGWRTPHTLLTNLSQQQYINTYNELWQNVLYQYHTVRSVPIQNFAPGYFKIQLLASQYKQKTDATHLTHWEENQFSKLAHEVQQQLISGNFPKDTAFIFTEDVRETIKITPDDSYFKYDDIYVLAPNTTKSCQKCQHVYSHE